MKPKLTGIIIAVVLGLGLLFVQQPSLAEKVEKLDLSKLESREVIIDPAELLDMMNDSGVKLKIIDVRDEADFNLFHIIDSEHAQTEKVSDPDWIKNLPDETVMVLISNDEKLAVEAWKIMSAQNVKNLYILAGGINLWISLYGEKTTQDNIAPLPDGNDKLRHSFKYALGSSHIGSDPDPHHVKKREYTKKVQSIGPAGRVSGGCS